MPLYRVVCDGIDILDYSRKDLVLLAPNLELELNTAGSFEFTMPSYHRYYDIVQMFKSTIEVYEDEECIWFGRPVEEKIDFYKQKKIYCEGALSFFNDTVQRSGEFNQIPLEQFFKDTITRHNEQADGPDRQFVCNYLMGTDYVYRKLDYESTYDVLMRMCLDTNAGYLFLGRVDGVNYIEWRKDMPFTCNQKIQFGLNLLDYSSSFEGTDFATCILPLGKSSTNEITGESSYVTITNINGGSDVLRSEAADTYGSIIKVERWSDLESPYDLIFEARQWLENTQFNASSIECSAADLHSKDGNYELFRVGQMVHCISNPHLVDKEFPLSKMSLKLDSAVKIITLGIVKRKTLTRIYKNDIDNIESSAPEPYSPEDYYPGIIPDDEGTEWELIMPENPGGVVTAGKLPTHITIARNPNKMDYEPGETLDFTGLLVRIWCNDQVWTGNGQLAYKDGHAPMRELKFTAKKAPNLKEYLVGVIWTYKGKNYHADIKFGRSADEYEWFAPGLNRPLYLTPVKVEDMFNDMTGPYTLVSEVEGNPLSFMVRSSSDPSNTSISSCFVSLQPFVIIARRKGFTGIERTIRSQQQIYDGKTYYYGNDGGYSGSAGRTWKVSAYQTKTIAEAAAILITKGSPVGG